METSALETAPYSVATPKLVEWERSKFHTTCRSTHKVGGGQAFLPALPTSFFFISPASSRHVSATAAFR